MNDHKRQASPSLPETSKKRHFVRNQSHCKHETACYDVNNSEDMQSGVVSKTGVSL